MHAGIFAANEAVDIKEIKTKTENFHIALYIRPKGPLPERKAASIPFTLPSKRSTTSDHCMLAQLLPSLHDQLMHS
jgi:hypothetical protein